MASDAQESRYNPTRHIYSKRLSTSPAHMHQTSNVASRSPSIIVRKIAKSSKLIILTCVIGALAGALVSHFTHPRWVGRMTIQIGQISTPENGGVTSRQVESQGVATARYNLPGFRMGILNNLGLPNPDGGDPDANLVFNSILISAARSPDLINLQVSAYSRDQAAAALTASFKAIAAVHQRTFDPALANMKSELQSASAKLAEAEGNYSRAYDSMRASTSKGDAANNNSHDVLVTNMVTLINTQILDLRKQTILLQQATSPMLTFPTRTIEPPYVPKRASTPSPALMIFAGALLGLLAGIAFAVRGMFRRG